MGPGDPHVSVTTKDKKGAYSPRPGVEPVTGARRARAEPVGLCGVVDKTRI